MVSTQNASKLPNEGTPLPMYLFNFSLSLNAKTLFYIFVNIFPLPTWHKISVKNTLIKVVQICASAHAVFFLYIIRCNGRFMHYFVCP